MARADVAGALRRADRAESRADVHTSPRQDADPRGAKLSQSLEQLRGERNQAHSGQATPEAKLESETTRFAEQRRQKAPEAQRQA